MQINSVTLVGRLTQNPQTEQTKSGLSVCTFTIASDRIGSDGSDFIDCVCWRAQADFLGRYGHKGQECGVEGRIQTRTYEDRDGRKRKVTEVLCRNVQLTKDGKTREVMTEQEIGVPEFDTGDKLKITADDLPF